MCTLHNCVRARCLSLLLSFIPCLLAALTLLHKGNFLLGISPPHLNSGCILLSAFEIMQLTAYS